MFYQVIKFLQPIKIHLLASQRLKFWRASTFWVIFIGYIGYYLCRKNLSAAFPLMSLEFGYSNSELGLIAAYSEIAYAIGKFVNGPLADKVGGKRIFLIGMGGAIVFNFIFAMSSTLLSFIVIWCLCRYFLSMGWGGLTKVIGNWYPPEKNGTIMGLVSITFQFGGVIAILFAGFLVAQGANWQGVFVFPAPSSFNHLDRVVLFVERSSQGRYTKHSIWIEPQRKKTNR